MITWHIHAACLGAGRLLATCPSLKLRSCRMCVCRRAVGSQVRTLGDMDADAEVQTLTLLRDRGLQPVGW